MADLIDKERAYTALKHEQYTHGLSFSTEAFEKAARIIDQMPTIEAEPVNRWIPVEDALPEIKEYHISETVLCYCDSGALAIARLEENGFGQVGFNCEKDDEYHHSAGKVLYWMPIPEIPEPPEKE